MSVPDMMAHLRALPLGLRGMGIGDPDNGGRIEAADVVTWAIAEIATLRLTDDELDVLAWLSSAADEGRDTIQRITPAMRSVIRGLLERHPLAWSAR